MSNTEIDSGDQANIPDEIKDLSFVREKRKELIRDMTAEGLPKDKGDRMVLLTALSDMDRAALTKLRIKSDDKKNEQNAQAASIIAKLLTSVSPANIAQDIPDNAVARPPTYEGSVEGSAFIDGQTAIGTHNTTYEEFVKTTS